MNRKRIILLIVAGGIIFVSYFFLRDNFGKYNLARDVFGNYKNFNAFMAASEVTVQRVHYRGRSEGDAGVLHDFGYTHDALLKVTDDQREELKRLLAAKSSYGWDYQKACIPNYAMIFHFHSADKVICVAFCFECRELGVFDSNANQVKEINTEDDFDPINGKLVAIAKSIFPNDPEIQAIK